VPPWMSEGRRLESTRGPIHCAEPDRRSWGRHRVAFAIDGADRASDCGRAIAIRGARQGRRCVRGAARTGGSQPRKPRAWIGTTSTAPLLVTDGRIACVWNADPGGAQSADVSGVAPFLSMLGARRILRACLGIASHFHATGPLRLSQVARRASMRRSAACGLPGIKTMP